MNRIWLSVMLVGCMSCGSAFAATAQQDKMTSCNADAKAKQYTGDTRKAFMSGCLMNLSDKTQQEKMGACNTTAGEKSYTGDARKAFLSGCLKK